MKNFTSPQPRYKLALLLASATVLLTASPALAQREIKHLSAFSALAGASQRATYYQAAYTRFLRDKLRLETSLLVEQGRRANPEERTKFRGYEFGIGVLPRLARFGEAIYLRVPIQLRTRYERTPATGGSPISDEWAVGPSAGLTVDVYVTDRLALSGEARAAYLFGNAAQRYPRYFGGGLSFFFGM